MISVEVSVFKTFTSSPARYCCQISHAVPDDAFPMRFSACCSWCSLGWMVSVNFQSCRMGSRQTLSLYEPLLEVPSCVIWGIQNVPSSLNKNRNHLSNPYCVFTKLSKHLQCEISTTFIKWDVKGTHADIPKRCLASLICALRLAFPLLGFSPASLIGSK